MAKVTGRESMLIFVGLVDVFFGMVFILMGADSVLLFEHGAIGVAMWTGIGFIMVGIGNILVVLTSSKTPKNEYFSINFGSLMLNLTGMVLAAVLIGFYAWGASSVLEAGLTGNSTATPTNADLISIFTTVILMAVLVLIMSLIAMFMDCCSFALFGTGIPGPGDYGPPPRPHTAMYDGPYGLPPSHMYKQ